MKFLYFSLLCFISSVSSTFYDELDQVSNEMVHEFMTGMNNMPALKDVLHLEHSEEAEQLDQDVKAELGKTLKGVLQELVGKIRNMMEHSKEISVKIVEKAKEIVEHLKESGRKGEVIEKIKVWIKTLQEKLNTEKRSLTNDLIGNALQELEINNLQQKLKNKILDRVDVQAIIKYIQRVFGESSTISKELIKALGTQDQQSLKTFINDFITGLTTTNNDERNASDISQVSCKILRHMDSILLIDKSFIPILIDVTTEENILLKERLLTALEIGIPTLRSLLNRNCLHGPISNAWNKVKEFFQGVGQGIKEKFSVFGSWLQGVAQSGWNQTKDKASQLKEIAQTVITNGKNLTSKAATQALEFFIEHKETIGLVLWKGVKTAAVSAIIGSIFG